MLLSWTSRGTYRSVTRPPPDLALRSSHQRDYASNEVVRLVVSDPAVRRFMAKFACGHLLENVEGSDMIPCQLRVRLSFDESSLPVHNLWSGLILHHSIEDKGLQYMQFNYEAFRNSLMYVCCLPLLCSNLMPYA